jgi:RNA polymerase sigma-70 factor (ECF subfamily)
MPDWQDTDENRLLKHAQDGDVDAYGKLYECHAGSVYRFLVAHLNDSLDAEDLTADVFFRAWRALPAYNQRGVPFLAYLLQIARNILIDHYRRSAQAKTVNLDTLEVILPEARGGSADETAETVQAALDQQRLRQVLNQLHPDHRTVLILRFLSGLSPRDAAQVMKRSEGAVRILQHRALAALRDLMTKE